MVTRYDPESYESISTMEEHSLGDWVTYDDYDDLYEEHKELQEYVINLKSMIKDLWNAV